MKDCLFKRKIVFLIVVVFLISIINVSSVKDKDKNKGPHIDPDIEKALQKNPEAFVIVSLKEPDDDILTKEEKGKFRIKDNNFTKLKRQKSQDKVISKLGKHEFKESRRHNELINAFSGKVKKSALKKLEKDIDVEGIYLNKVVAYSMLDESIPVIEADIAHNTILPPVGTITGKGETICIIDSGIDSSHPDLRNERIVTDSYNIDHLRQEGFKVLLEKCYCIGTFGASNCCYNPTSGTYNLLESEGPGSSRSPFDGHGTHVAGIAAAKKNPSSTYGVTGVAPDADIIMVKAQDDNFYFIDQGTTIRGAYSTADLLSAVGFCASKNPTVISMSIGSGVYGPSEACGPSSTIPVSNAIINAINRGIPVVAASGNDAYSDGISWPACIPEVISVASTKSGKYRALGGGDLPRISDFSNIEESMVDIAAPGDIVYRSSFQRQAWYLIDPLDKYDIYSTWPTYLDNLPIPYKVLVGTSMAAPHVSGSIALLQQYANSKNIRLTPSQINSALRSSSILATYRPPTLFALTFFSTTQPPPITFPFLQVEDSGRWVNALTDTVSYRSDSLTGQLEQTVLPAPTPIPLPPPVPPPEPGAFTIDARPVTCTTAHVSITEFLANPPTWYDVFKNTDSSNTRWSAYAQIPTGELDVTGLTPGSLNSFFVRAEYTGPGTPYAIVDSNKIYVQLPVCDSKAPDLIIVEPKNRTYNSIEYLGLNFAVHDSTVLDRVWYRIDNGSNISVAGNETLNIFSLAVSALNLLETGAPESLDYINSTGRTLHLWARDIYGNMNYTNVTFARNIFEIRVNTPPVIYTNTGDIKFNVTVNLATSQYNIKNVSLYGNWVNGNLTVNETNSSGLANTDYIFTKNLSGYNDSIYSWKVNVCDTFGYCRDTGTGAILLDKTKPIVNLLTNNNSWTTRSFKFEVDDLTPVTCYLYGDFNGTYALNRSTSDNNTNETFTRNGLSNKLSYTFSIPGIKDNSTGYLWNVMCNDSLGNYAFNSTNFTAKVDTIVPLINFTTGTTTNKSLAQNSIFANISVSDLNMANITINLHNSSGYFKSVNLNASGSYNFTNLNDDIYDLYAIVSDLAGNTNYTEIRTIILDNEYPIVSLVYPLNNSLHSPDDSTFTYIVKDVLIDNCTLAVNRTLNQTFNVINVNENNNIFLSNLSEGVYYWNVSCTDTLNRKSTSATFKARVYSGFKAISITETSRSQFASGTNQQTSATVNSDNVILANSTPTTYYNFGNFTSGIIDSRSPTTTWNIISWLGEYPYGKEIKTDPEDYTPREITPYASNLNGLILLYHFNNNTEIGENETNITDSSGLNNYGFSNGTTPATDTRNKVFGKAAKTFDGIDDQIWVKDSASLSITNNFTAMFWVRPSQTKSTRVPLNFKEDVAFGTGFDMRIETDGWDVNASLYTRNPYTRTTGGNIGPWLWYHIAAIYDGQTQRLYINGEEVASTPRTGSIGANSNPVEIGKNAGFGDYFNGSLDELAIWNKSLSAREIKNFYLKSKPMDNLVALYHFNNASGEDETQITDSSGYSNHGKTLNSITSPRTDKSDKVFGQASKTFDGVDDYINLSNTWPLDIKDKITIEAWIKPASLGNTGSIYNRRNASNNFGITLESSGNGSIQFQITNGGGLYSNAVPLNQWSHVAGVYDGNYIRIYINGIESNYMPSSGILNGTVNDSIDAIIGKNIVNGHVFNGKIDELAVWNKNLGPEDIRNHYLRGILNLTFQVRSCDDSLCNGEQFIGPDNTINTFFTNATSGDLSNIAQNRYFQYKAYFETKDTKFTPNLNEFTILGDSAIDVFNITYGGNAIARFDARGNIMLKGKCYVQADCVSSTDSFVIKNQNSVTSYINSTGDLCLETGDCSDNTAQCNAPDGSFLIRSFDNDVKSYIDKTGDLCLEGRLTQNAI